jgi:hypothetical protein
MTRERCWRLDGFAPGLLTKLGFASEKQKQIPFGNDKQEKQEQGQQWIPFGNDKQKSNATARAKTTADSFRE